MQNSNSFLMIFLVIYFLFIFAVSVLTYVFHALGLMAIVRNRDIGPAGLAWLPIIGPSYLTGCVADHYDRQTSGSDRSLGSWLLSLSIVLTVLQPILIGLMWTGRVYEQAVPPLPFVIALLAMLAAGLPYTVLWYIALYKLFKSCQPANSVLFLVLSILFSLTPFLVFAVRNSVNGQRVIQRSGF